MRVASWNLAGRSGDTAARLGAVLANHGGADLVLLQEASKRGLPEFAEAAGLDWHTHIRSLAPDLLKARGRSGKPGSRGRPRSVALAGRGGPAASPVVFPDVPLPEKVMAAWIDLDGTQTAVVTYHAPTGVQHKLKKPIQAVRIAEWIASLQGPVILGGDFTTPKLDPPAVEGVRTHWHTGDDKLGGPPGDDRLVGERPIHELRDVYRLWLSEHPEEMERIRQLRPDGPLEVSFCTDDDGERQFRYDAIWATPHFSVESVEYIYEEAIEARTDHALVLAQLTLADQGLTA
ncbi:MAG: endonuclease/exonuclease/phosphatase family protein [bacterium]|nr:endonuclease/exonuclease/phosphatase family protein [bacterium]